MTKCTTNQDDVTVQFPYAGLSFDLMETRCYKEGLSHLRRARNVQEWLVTTFPMLPNHLIKYG
jgi:hypothetical protein